ncbi:MAG: leucine-rich repeat domain-containing protein [Clostridiales bacterium]|nr:leucine-rich repeat domain-containing protein [Clostridiales bacterium]
MVGLSSKDVKKEIEGYMGYLFKKEKDERVLATYTEKFFEYVKRCSIYTDDRFLHQTFEEYFTACHLYSAARQKESVKVGLKILEKVTIDDAVIDEIITQYKGSEYWKAIVEMLILYIDSKIEEKDTAKIGTGTGEEVNIIGYLFDRLLGATEIEYDWNNRSQYDWFCGVAVKTANNRKAAFASLTKSLLIRAIEGKENPYKEMFFYVPVYRMYSGVVSAFESLKKSRTDEEIEMARILCGEIFEYYSDDMDEGDERFPYTRSEDQEIDVRGTEKKLADRKAELNIGEISFFGMGSLKHTYIFISKDFKKEEAYIFSGYCKKIIVDPKNKSVAIKDYHLYSSDFKTLIKFCGGLGIEVFTMPNMVKTIWHGAFCGCSSLQKIKLPNTVQTIKDDAFEGCSDLKEINLADTAVQTIGVSAFLNCRGLQKMELSNTVQTIGDSAFMGCSGLHTIELPNTVKTIGYDAFLGCSELKEIKSSLSLKKIAKSIYGCYSLERIYESKTGCIYYKEDGVFYNKDKTKLIRYLNKRQENFTVPNTVQSICEDAFYRCRDLKEIKLSDTLQTISDSAFCGCSGLKEIELPNMVQTIGNFAFSECKGLKEIKLPNTLQTIGNRAFSDCSGLQKIELPNKVRTIGNSSFSDCSSLQEIKLSDMLQTIEEGAFEWCSCLQKIELPNTVQIIGDYAFYQCDNLKTIYVHSEAVADLVRKSGYKGGIEILPLNERG